MHGLPLHQPAACLVSRINAANITLHQVMLTQMPAVTPVPPWRHHMPPVRPVQTDKEPPHQRMLHLIRLRPCKHSRRQQQGHQREKLGQNRQPQLLQGMCNGCQQAWQPPWEGVRRP